MKTLSSKKTPNNDFRQYLYSYLLTINTSTTTMTIMITVAPIPPPITGPIGLDWLAVALATNIS